MLFTQLVRAFSTEAGDLFIIEDLQMGTGEVQQKDWATSSHVNKYQQGILYFAKLTNL